MPANAELYQLAVRAQQDYYRDRSVPMSDIKEGLMGLRAELDALIGAAKAQIAKDKEEAKAVREPKKSRRKATK